MSNKNGWYINYATNGIPTNSYGPFDESITITKALNFIAVQLALEHD